MDQLDVHTYSCLVSTSKKGQVEGGYFQMEKLSTSETTRKACDGSNSIANDKLEVVIDLGKEPSEKGYNCRIEKVPLLLRNHENNKGDYDPKVVSLGPYHHGKPELQLVENLKPMMARLFVSDSGKDLDEFYNKILDKVVDIRSCYVEGSTNTYSDEKFADMMLLDGCFILGMIESFVVSDQERGQKSKYDEVLSHLGMLVSNSIWLDFVLLENQLPFQVLELLMSLKFKYDEGMEMIDEFLDIHTSWHLKFRNKKEVKVSEYVKNPLHFFQLFLTKILLYQCGDGVIQPLHNLNSQREKIRFKSLLNPKAYTHSFHSITELKAKGIYFRPSSSISVMAIKFKSCWFYGLLEFPILLITPHTKILLSNMIAYELYSGIPNNLAITSFTGFLKSLIVHPHDVKELLSKQILFSRCGSDEEVVNIFKEITTFSLEDYGIYEDVRQRIQDHFNNKAKTWIAEFIHNYFSSPWTVITFIAASSLVALTFVQTFFTVFPRSCK